MKDKIIEILYKNGIANGDYRYYKARHAEKAADEILELFHDCEDYRATDSVCGHDECFRCGKVLERPSAQELNMKVVRCACRHCQPDNWEEDDRGFWIRIFQTE